MIAWMLLQIWIQLKVSFGPNPPPRNRLSSNGNYHFLKPFSSAHTVYNRGDRINLSGNGLCLSKYGEYGAFAPVERRRVTKRSIWVDSGGIVNVLRRTVVGLLCCGIGVWNCRIAVISPA